jgi:hypothetical protein
MLGGSANLLSRPRKEVAELIALHVHVVLETQRTTSAGAFTCALPLTTACVLVLPSSMQCCADFLCMIQPACRIAAVL